MLLQLLPLLQLIHSEQHLNLQLNFISGLVHHEFLKLFMLQFLLHPKIIDILNIHVIN